MSPFVLIYLALIPPIYAKGGGRGGGGGGRGYSSGRSYPASTGLSGNTYRSPAAPTYHQTHSYPSSTGLSGNSPRTTYTSTSHTTHYHYAPPQQINYGSTHHPVYQGTPPVYVYQYKESGSKFDNLLTGLALYNLGRMSANSHSYDYNHGGYNQGYRYDKEYRGSSGEVCKFAINKKNGEYEETRIDCKLMSSFIWDVERESVTQNSNVITKSVSVVQTKDGNSTVTVQNTTIVDAREVKGPSIQVTKEMTCFMIRVSGNTSILKKKVDCGLLQEYATKSMQYRNSCERALPVITVMLSILTIILL